jgi:hypothetical protein
MNSDDIPIEMPYKMLRHCMDMSLVNKVDVLPVNKDPNIGHAKLTPIVSMAIIRNNTMIV